MSRKKQQFRHENGFGSIIKLSGKDKIFTANEIKTLWNDVNNPTAQWILILLYSGMRIGEWLCVGCV